MLAHYERYNPFRDPSWRQERVLALVDRQPEPAQPHRVHDDDYIKIYYSFLRHFKGGTEEDRIRLFEEDPGLYYAYAFRNQPDFEWKALLEARLLARESDEYIAANLGTLPGTITWYEKLFYNVRDRLHSRDYIIKACLGKSLAREVGRDDTLPDPVRYTCYKLFGYFGGPIVLDVIMSGFGDNPFPLKPEKAEEWLDHSIRTAICSRGAMASQVFKIDKWNVMQLLEIQQRFIQFEQEARLSSGGASAEYQQNIESFFEQIPLSIGRAAKEGSSPETLKFTNTAVEPRADEQLALSVGVVPEVMAEKEAFVRPLPREDVNDGKTDGQDS